MEVSPYPVLAHTPNWVLILFAYLLWIGVMRLRPSVRQVGRVWITPGMFIAWGIVGLLKRPGNFSFILAHWCIGAAVGAALGSFGNMGLIADRPRQLVRLRGSVMPLIRIMTIFGAHYALQATAALHPERADALMAWDIDVSGASAGYFLAWSLRFLRSYRRAPQADLAPVVALKG